MVENQKKETPKTLYVINLWDGNALCSYVVVEEDIQKASEVAKKLRIEDRTEDERTDSDPQIDWDLSYDATVASDRNGSLYDILVTPTKLIV
ncbi:hypothetical protein ACFOQM_09635 [Paenibacillus sp. GCM10012307]|uniref:Uncharacterized protein n=1 Tax=Paenibacillus roseus TaxID=2798579 RepID=A0A934IYF6_9BACL|nr:hypothetical protein [Paenibacillus roseus]MBJ6361547.1 hypothetical protein [Paenibacillus roseus]